MLPAKAHGNAPALHLCQLNVLRVYRTKNNVNDFFGFRLIVHGCLHAEFSLLVQNGGAILSVEKTGIKADMFLTPVSSLTVNGERLTPRLAVVEFPSIEEMKAERGDSHLEISAALPRKDSTPLANLAWQIITRTASRPIR